MFGTIFVVAQQVERQGADDAPQRLASQVAAEVRVGTTSTVDDAPGVDLGHSLAPFVVVVDASDSVAQGTASLEGAPLAIPRGVLQTARRSGSDAVTWEARDDLRFALVEIAVGSRVVVAGQSLAPSESRTDRLGLLVLIAWLGTSAAAVVGVYGDAAWARVVRGRSPSRGAVP